MNHHKKIFKKIALLSPIIFIMLLALWYQTKLGQDKNVNKALTKNQRPAITKHFFKKLNKEVYLTPEERVELCNERGIQYLANLQAAPEFVALITPQYDKKYSENQEECDRLTALYGDEIANGYVAPISIRWINENVGYGVFAESDLVAGELLGEYTGKVEVIAKIVDKDYAWRYDVGSLFEKRHALDASKGGNEMRFVNDSQTHPNCKREYVLGYDNLWHVLYVVTKDIKKGQQCLVRYSPEYWKSRPYAYEVFTH